MLRNRIFLTRHEKMQISHSFNNYVFCKFDFIFFIYDNIH